MAIFKLTLKELQDAFAGGKTSAYEIARAYYLRLSVVESKVKAYVTINDKEGILEQAKAIDEETEILAKNHATYGHADCH